MATNHAGTNTNSRDFFIPDYRHIHSSPKQCTIPRTCGFTHRGRTLTPHQCEPFAQWAGPVGKTPAATDYGSPALFLKRPEGRAPSTGPRLYRRPAAA